MPLRNLNTQDFITKSNKITKKKQNNNVYQMEIKKNRTESNQITKFLNREK